MRYVRNVGLGLDSALNALTGGDPDSTISLRIAQAAKAGKRWGKVGCWFLRVIFRQPHCDEQMNTEEAREDA